MTLTIFTAGSRGDVAPYAALGSALREAGHDVRLVTHRLFQELVEDHGLEFAPMPGNPRTYVEDSRWSSRLKSSRLATLRALRIALERLTRDLTTTDLEGMCGDADAVLFTYTAPFGLRAARELGLPHSCVTNRPVHSTRAFPDPILFPGRRFGPAANRRSYGVGDRVLRRPMRRLACPVVYGFSPTVLPRPADWPADAHVAGWWDSAAAEAELAPEIQDFLAAGEPPVLVGFGSTPVARPERLWDAVLAAARETGVRLIIVMGWSGDVGLPRDEPGVLVTGEVPYGALLPHVRAFVHHGGTGTTHFGLSVGKPSLAVWLMSDQPFWGHRIAALGAGPAPIAQRRVSAGALTRAFQVLCDDRTEIAARSVGESMSSEDGLASGVRMVERALG